MTKEKLTITPGPYGEEVIAEGTTAIKEYTKMRAKEIWTPKRLKVGFVRFCGKFSGWLVAFFIRSQ